MANKNKIKLGDKVRCQHTGVQGTAVQRIQYFKRAEDQIGIYPDSQADSGGLPSMEYIQENWLEIMVDKPKGITPD